MTVALTLTWDSPFKLPTINGERSQTLWDHRKVTASIREQWGWLGVAALRERGGPFIAPIHIEACPLQHRGKLADTGAHVPALKAAVDGLVDSGLLPDDGPTTIPKIVYRAPRRAAQPGLTLVLYQGDPDNDHAE